MKQAIKKSMGMLMVSLTLSVSLVGCNLALNNNAVYVLEDAYVFDTSYTYAVSAEKEDDYPIEIKGGKLFNEVGLKVNGILQEESSGNKVHLRKGLNSITLENGSNVSEITIGGSGRRNSNGAFTTYTSYEAEDGETNATISEDNREYREAISSEASNRRYVELKNEGDYVSITLEEAANAFVLRYCIPDSEDGEGIEANINLYMGEEKQAVEVTSKYSWVYGNYPWNNDPSTSDIGGGHMFFDDVRVVLNKTYSAGTVFKFQKDKENTAKYYLIDLIEAEEIDGLIEMPTNALNVAEFGAIPNDGQDDAMAILDCIKKAAKNKQEVYIPAGVFEIGNPIFVNGIKINQNNTTIRGAGMWHTILKGESAGFVVDAANVSFYDFSLIGNVTQRKNSIDPPAFNMVRPVMGRENIMLQNIWMEHWKVGLWADVTNGIDIIGCRIRNTYADGINLCAGTSNSMVTHTDLRNNGDDAIAMFNRGVLCTNNKVKYNTVALPWLANNIAIYGGKDIEISHNWLKDTVCFGSAINISTNFTPQVFEGTILVENNKIERSGSRKYDEGVDCGAIWINTIEGYDNTANCIIRSNEIIDSTFQGISFLNSGKVENMIIENNSINGCGTYGIEAGKGVIGSTTLKGNKIHATKKEAIKNNEEDKFEFIMK